MDLEAISDERLQIELEEAGERAKCLRAQIVDLRREACSEERQFRLLTDEIERRVNEGKAERGE